MPIKCVFGCRKSDWTLHVFPNANKDPKRNKTWIDTVRRHLNTTDDPEFYLNRRICDKHFTEDCKTRNNRLSALAVPSLHLPGSSPTLKIPSNPEWEPMLFSDILPSSDSSVADDDFCLPGKSIPENPKIEPIISQSTQCLPDTGDTTITCSTELPRAESLTHEGPVVHLNLCKHSENASDL